MMKRVSRRTPRFWVPIAFLWIPIAAWGAADGHPATETPEPAPPAPAQGFPVSLNQLNDLVDQLARCRRSEEQHKDQLEKMRGDRAGQIQAQQERIADLTTENEVLRGDLKVARLNLDQARRLSEELALSLSACQETEKAHRNQEQLDQFRVRIATLEGELTDAKQSAETTIQNLQLQVVTAQGERDNLQAALNESEWVLEGVKQKLQETQETLKILRDRLPLYAGGTGIQERLQQEAADWFRKLEALYHRPHPELSLAEWRRARKRLQDALAEKQQQRAELLGAEGLYQVQPQDRLADISQRVYRNPQGWQRIYEANWQLIPDPDRLLPGITLVIPRLAPPAQ